MTRNSILVRSQAQIKLIENTVNKLVGLRFNAPILSNAMPSASGAIAYQNAKQGTAFNFQIPTNTCYSSQ